MHVRLADESVCIGPPPAATATSTSRACSPPARSPAPTPIHPGYGFLSENARFAEILEEHQITFIGPTSEHIRIMGDKIEAKETAKKLGIPVVPGSEGAVKSETEAMKVAKDMGLSRAHQGGRRRRRARHEGRPRGLRLGLALSTARAEAKAAFGNDSVYIEKYLEAAAPHRDPGARRRQGNAVHLGERDCSLQRRHQKVWRRRPRPRSTPSRARDDRRTVRQRHAQDRLPRRRHVEFLYEDGEFYFIEMNTRLQVEHPVTEMITGLDLVHRADPRRRRLAAVLRQPAGRHVRGPRHRVPHQRRERAHLPALAGGHHLLAPAGRPRRARRSRRLPGLRIPPYYDSLIGKLIVHGKTRNECLMRLKRALSEFVIDGIETTIPLFNELIRQPDIANGIYDIHWLESS